MKRPFGLAALNPPGTTDAAIPIAAGRAGGLGILDLTLAADAAAAASALEALARHGRGSLGARLDSTRPDLVERVADALPAAVETVLLMPGESGALREAVALLRPRVRTLLMEATSLDEALEGAGLGVDGLIARGHEAAGRVGDETTFILLQRLLARSGLPVWAWGGIGLHSATACYAAGAAGVVLDLQLALTRESPLPSRARSVLRRMDGSETTTAGAGIGEPVRVYDRQGLPPVLQLHRAAAELETDTGSRLDRLRAWRRRVRELAGWGPPERHLWLIGQDAAFAAPLASRFRTVGGILEGMRGAIDENIATSAARRPLDAGSPLARSHGTTYPIVQGPMTRVSDNAAFALEVARGGALPFLALALMRAPEVRDLLRETRDRLGERPWGVGILGFVPLELRQEQLEVIREFRPPFALIAGGRPDQARALEEDGIRTYLHVPSPGLLEMFLENGARRFVFEGRECGGHVGPRSSFVLWNGMVDTLLESLPDDDLSSCHVLFAAGIHDALSSSMVAAMAAPLAARGARIGVLLGTSYLFTREAVATGAIVEGFQKEAIRCERTVLLETGPGHATRCTDSPYARTFEEERRRLLAEGREPESVRNALEALNLGRLRIASKGVDRHPRYGRDPDAPKLVPLGTDEQTQSGMFMIGQVAALRSATCTIEELHRDVSIAGSARLADLERPRLSAAASRPERPLDVAIVGMACLLPGAPGLRSFWRNILGKVDAITEIPGDRWDWRRYFDDKPRARDRIYSRWGGFLDETPFDPMRYGMPPSSLASIEPLQLLTLEVSRAALQDAGYLDRPFDRRHTSVILGAGGGVSDLGALYAFRSLLPSFIQDPPEAILKRLPEWTEDSFPGILLNVAAGRVANRFDLGGLNCTIDAACASSLAAVYMASKELETGASDMVIVGGADTAQNPFMYLCFSQTGAHSGSGRCRTFDEGADGIAISEGIAVMVMKRLADAERDGDRIYAVLKAIAASSDGRDRGLTAPRPEGQALALERAYRQAGFSPATVGLIEAHGTGTVAGDQAEVTTLRRVFESAGAGRHDCAIGSVKSMIGHTKCTAGVAGMIKATLALHHRLLPPTLHVESPNRKASFADSPLYVNSEVRPWIRTDPDRPRRAGVSAFGFGGTNFHAVLEEYADSIPGTVTTDLAWDRPAEIFLWRGATRDELVRQVASVAEALARGADPQPDALARALHDIARDRDGAPGPSCAIVASSIADLRDKIDLFREAVSRGAERSGDPSGVYFTAEPLAGEGRIAFLFPGQGSQYPGMLADLAARFAIVRERFELAGSVLRERLPEHLGRYVFPPPSFGPEQERASKEVLTATNVAQPALGAAGMAAFHLLSSFGVRPDMAAGHSYGEYVALCAAGVIDEQSLAMISEARGRSIIESAKEDLGTMAAAACEAGRIREVLGESGDVWIANLNAPRQTVLSGSRRGIERAAARLQEAGITLRPIPVACAFHSPLVAPAGDRLSASLATLSYSAPRFPVYSNASAAPYPGDAHGIRRLLSDHLVSPVRFADEIRAMHDAGARIFVEAGPRDVLSGLTRQILEGRPHLAVSADSPGRPGLLHLLHLLARLAVHGVPLRLDPLFGRIESSEQAAEDAPDLAALLRQDVKAPLSPAVWMVGGGHARPIGRDRPASAPAPLALEGRRPEGTVEIAPAEARADEATRSARRPLVASPAAAGPPSPMTQILKEYQETMNRFLDTQRAVMQAYLTGTPLERRDAPEAAAQIPAGTTPETESTAEARPGVAPPESEAAAPASAAAPAPEAIQPPAAPDGGVRERLLSIVAERPGYPAEMLDLDLNIQADLGIDSIKRVDILGALQRQSDPAFAPRLQGAMEEHTRAKTLRAINGIAGALESSGDGDTGAATNGEPAPAAAAGKASTDARSPAPPAAAAPEATATPAAPHGGVRERLLSIVAERTGYPAEMLDLDLNIEADLGIDSIKRVEILGALQRRSDPAFAPRLQGAMEELTRARTLRAIIGIAGALEAAGDRPAASAGAETTAEATRPPDAAQAAAVPRFLTRLVEATPGGGSPAALPRAPILITDDGGGIARTLAEDLRRAGAVTALIRPGPESTEAEPGIFTADLLAPRGAEALIEIVTERLGVPAGIIHLLPLGRPPGAWRDSIGAWKNGIDRDVKSLFRLARAASPSLRTAGRAGGALLFAATSLDGGGREPDGGEPRFPGRGGVAGLIRTLAVEWPEVRCRAVDLGRRDGTDASARRILRELLEDDREIDIAYRDGRRLVPRPVEAPLPDARPDAPRITRDSVILITGGARGITAEVAREIAARHGPTLVLVGRSPLSADPEPPEIRGIDAPHELKAALIGIASRSGATPRPAEIEAAVRRLLREREIRRNLEAIGRHGARAHYVAADVRDDAALGELLDRIEREHGRIDGVIHGAGLIEDRLIEDKTPESFDRVFDTKADGAFILSRRLRRDALRFFVLFASVAGRFGNRGQCDYAAANEALNDLAAALDRDLPGRVVAINWGPWGRTGMASAEVQRRFAERGVQLIPPEGGRAAAVDEIERGAKGEVEVILGDGPWRGAGVPEPAPSTDAEELPLLHGVTASPGGNGRVELSRVLDPERDLYLRDHQLDGHPVLPAAVAIEMMAETVRRQWPESEVIGVESFRLLNGVVLENGAKPLRITARPAARADAGADGEAIDVEIADPAGRRVFYRATCRVGPALPAAPADPDPEVADLRPFPMSVAEAYDRWLFHGPLFQGIESFEGFSDRAIAATLLPSSPGRLLRGATAPEWIFDPVLIDSAFQLTLLFSRARSDMTPLPARFRRLRRFAATNGTRLRCVVRARTDAGGHHLETQTLILNDAGRIVVSLEDAEFTASRDLNRLAGRWIRRGAE